MPATSDYEAANRAFIRKLQARNQVKRELQEAGKESGDAERARREQNFSVCFSGANARKSPQHTRSTRNRSGSHLSQERHAGGWRQWEENTVEIAGHSGEVFSLRPTGERKLLRGVQEPETDFNRVIRSNSFNLSRSLRAAAEDCPSGPVTPTGGQRAAAFAPSLTQRELHDLLVELEGEESLGVQDLEEESQHLSAPAEPQEEDAAKGASQAPTRPTTASSERAAVSDEPTAAASTRPTSAREVPEGEEEPQRPRWSRSCSLSEPKEDRGPSLLAEAEEVLNASPTPEQLADRILQLPLPWREKLLQALEEAEAAAAVAEVH